MKEKERMMKISSIIAIFGCLVAVVCFGRQRSDFEDVQFCSLRLGIEYDLTGNGANTIYELEEGSQFGVLQVNEDGTIVARTENKYALIVPRSSDLVDHQKVYGPRYYRYVGTGHFSFSAVDRKNTVRKFKEVSQREFEKIEAFRQELLARIEEQKRMHRRQACLDKVLSGIRDLTDDEKTINFTYEKVGEKYDEVYRKTGSESDAEAMAKVAADALLDILVKENEKKELAKKKEFEEWTRTHPEEYAEMLKAEEEERQRKAKLKLEAELAENDKRMGVIKAAAESFRESNPIGAVPKDIDELRKFKLRISLPRRDVWGAELSYDCTAKAFSIISNGPDGKKGTQDDIVHIVEACKPEESPIARTVASLQKRVAELSREVKAYSAAKIPSICGFRFGSESDGLVEGGEKTVALEKPFRKCTDAVLRYAGQVNLRLTQVILVGRFSQENGGPAQSHDEGRKIADLLGRNFKMRFGVVDREGCIVASCQSDGMKVEIRNDTICQDGTGDVILTVSFEDQNLQKLLNDLDVAFGELEVAERNYEAARKSAASQGGTHHKSSSSEEVDNEGLDVLSGVSSEVKSEDAAKADKDDADKGDFAKEQLKSIKEFRKRMEERRKAQAQLNLQKPSRRRSGIIESKGEGRPISTTD